MTEVSSGIREDGPSSNVVLRLCETHVSKSLPTSTMWVKIISLIASPVECLEVKAVLCLPKTDLYNSICKWWRCSSPDKEGGSLQAAHSLNFYVEQTQFSLWF